MPKRTDYYEERLLAELKCGNESAFSILFDIYYRDLVLYCGRYIGVAAQCEDIVQNVFFRLWRDRNVIRIESSLKSYLLQAVRNHCFDEYRHRRSVRAHVSSIIDSPLVYNYETENYVLYSDLEDKLQELMDMLPEKYREVFTMNRFDNLKYREIAKRLNVSERTVEVRIGKALDYLRIHLKEFVFAILFLLSVLV